MAYTANFEKGTDGNTITTAAGEADLTKFDWVFGTPTYTDEVTPAHGSLCMKCSGESHAIEWNLPALQHYARLYVYIPSASMPDTTGSSIYSERIGGAIRLQINTDGTWRMYDSSSFGGHSLTSTGTVATDQWVRFELFIAHSTTVGQIICRYFEDADSDIPTEVLTSPATWWTGDGTDIRVDIGTGGASTYGFLGPIYMDCLVANATDWVGPAAAPPQSTDVLSMQSHVFGHNMW